ncbi:S8 family serine peptidase [candidate division GN15 bacterium]|nr:S8 family serine peptidase [candidate division GN15 bacterium]
MYGSEDINLGKCPSIDTLGHGTRIASIAAGNKSGVAPDAELVVVKIAERASDFELIRGIRFVKHVADSLDLPYILCLCHGYRSGARDGESDPLEAGLTGLLADTSRGNLLKAVVVAAGNDNYDPRFPVRYGNNRLHARQAGNGSFAMEIHTTAEAQGDDRCYAEIWYPAPAGYRVSLVSPAGRRYGPVSPEDPALRTSSPDGRIFIDNDRLDTLTWGSIRVIMGDPQTVTDTLLDNLLAEGRWQIVLDDPTGVGGTWDAYVTYVAPDTLEKAIVEEDHDNSYKILSGGNVKAAITVGSVNSRAAALMSGELRELYASRFPIGRISHFSSRGPTRGLTPELEAAKPEIYAEGALVEIALSGELSADIRDAYESEGFPMTWHYGVGYGTSEAAPRVAGVVALMVAEDRDHSLTHATIKEILLKSADRRKQDNEEHLLLDIDAAVRLSRMY